MKVSRVKTRWTASGPTEMGISQVRRLSLLGGGVLKGKQGKKLQIDIWGPMRFKDVKVVY